jgi:hypothetical protein
MTDTDPIRPATAVPDGESPAARCPYCERPFASERLRAIHVGETHADRATDAERTTYESARDEEGDSLFVYHLKIIGALVALYAILVVLYMVVLGTQPG